MRKRASIPRHWPRARAVDVAAGFTLLEVLVAVGVLAVLLVPILQVLGTGMSSGDRARAVVTATLLARSRLAELGVENKLREGEESGRFDNGFVWRARVTRDDSPILGRDEQIVGARRARTGGDPLRRGREEERSGIVAPSSGGLGSGSSFGSRTTSGFGNRATGSGIGGGSSRFGGGAGSDRGDPPRDLGDGTEETELIPYRIDLTVEWAGGGPGRSIHVSTVRLQRPATSATFGR